MYFVFAVVGTSLFAKTRFGNFYTIDANFRTFEKGLLLLFRMSTGVFVLPARGFLALYVPCSVAYGFIAL